MEITSQRVDDFMEVLAKGRLDTYWADHLAAALEEILRQGHDRIRLNLSEVVYISSMGIRVLVMYYRKLGAIDGLFVISEPSPFVSKTLEMMGLLTKLTAGVPVAKQETAAAEGFEETPEYVVREVRSVSPGFEGWHAVRACGKRKFGGGLWLHRARLPGGVVP